MQKYDLNCQIFRNKVKRNIQDFLEKKEFIEVETPILSRKAIPEPTISLFETKRKKFDNEELFYLLPSPELYMKRMLFEYKKSIYQFSKCFRNSEQSGKEHANEFTMLEYYKINSDCMEQAKLTEEMFIEIFNNFSRNNSCNGFIYKSMRDIVLDITNLDIDKLQHKKDLRMAIKEIGIFVQDEDESWADTFNRLFISKVEPELLNYNKPLLIYDYPVQIECLAKNKNDKYKYRWELYYKGIELANCYSETTSTADTQLFIEKEYNEIKKNIPNFMVDSDIVSFTPLPESSGVALGFDRLIMILMDKKNIEEVMSFHKEIS